jgi:hypothetical protein
VKIEVVIPVVQYDLAVDLLDQIDGNILTPDRVLVVDNGGSTPLWGSYKNFELSVLYSQTGRLNESWEVARAQLSPDTDYVAFFNDDIIIGNWFFQRIMETFASYSRYGIACPNVVLEPEGVKKGKVDYRTGRRWKMESCAFVIKKEILDKIPAVPWERITTFYGDDWVLRHTRELGYFWGMDLGNNIYHYIGKTVQERGFRSLKKPEFNEWQKILQETWGKRKKKDKK